VHLVGFIITIYHDALSPERQIRQMKLHIVDSQVTEKQKVHMSPAILLTFFVGLSPGLRESADRSAVH